MRNYFGVTQVVDARVARSTLSFPRPQIKEGKGSAIYTPHCTSTQSHYSEISATPFIVILLPLGGLIGPSVAGNFPPSHIN